MENFIDFVSRLLCEISRLSSRRRLCFVVSSHKFPCFVCSIWERATFKPMTIPEHSRAISSRLVDFGFSAVTVWCCWFARKADFCRRDFRALNVRFEKKDFWRGHACDENMHDFEGLDQPQNGGGGRMPSSRLTVTVCIRYFVGATLNGFALTSGRYCPQPALRLSFAKILSRDAKDPLCYTSFPALPNVCILHTSSPLRVERGCLSPASNCRRCQADSSSRYYCIISFRV